MAMEDFEVELKFAVPSEGMLRERIAKLGAVPRGGKEQQDVYFNHPQRDFRETDEALRVRQDGEKNVVTYKGPKIDPLSKTRKEIEIPIGAGMGVRDGMANILRELGFREGGRVVKRREEYEYEREGVPIHIAVDAVEGLGTFLELEGNAPLDRVEGVRDLLLSIAHELGLEHGERRSYLELLAERNRG